MKARARARSDEAPQRSTIDNQRLLSFFLVSHDDDTIDVLGLALISKLCTLCSVGRSKTITMQIRLLLCLNGCTDTDRTLLSFS
jgi:hypothetical protein